MQYDNITTEEELTALYQRLREAKVIAFDTEFVSEHTYRPELCLLQIAADGYYAIVDTLAVPDLDEFWKILAEGDHRTIVHAGRQEICFSIDAIDTVPNNLFDLQVAAGLIGLEYPAGYGSLVSKLLSEKIKKGETRTDWRKRPLSEQQMQYALLDVVYLEGMYNKLSDRLAELERSEWFETEMQAWFNQIDESYRRERWHRVSGTSGLGVRSKAVVREIWRWREGEAKRRNLPPRRVLRDDLIVELAKRRTDDPKRIGAVRGMDRGDLKRALPQLCEAVRTAMDLPEDDLPRSKHRAQLPSQLNVLGQFLSSALGSICRKAHLAPGMVGNPSDVRELIAYRLGYFHDDNEAPALSQGWRATVVGQQIDDLLSGKLSIRITDPKNEQPLSFEPVE